MSEWQHFQLGVGVVCALFAVFAAARLTTDEANGWTVLAFFINMLAAALNISAAFP